MQIDHLNLRNCAARYFVIWCLLAGYDACSGPLEIQWQKGFGGSGSDEASVVRQTADGGYIIGGSSSSATNGNKLTGSYSGYDYWVVKVDRDGNRQWEADFGGMSDDQLYDIEVSSDGGYLLGGYSRSCLAGNKTAACRGGYDFWVVKLDQNGNWQWDQTYGGLGTDWLTSLRQTSDGGYVLAGLSDSVVSTNKNGTAFGFQDYWLVKTDASGNRQWDATFGGTNVDVPNCVRQTSDGGFIIAGSSSSGISGNKTSAWYGGFDYWLVKLRLLPHFEVTTATAQSFHAQLFGIPSTSYVFECSQELTNWTALRTNSSINGLITFDDDSAGSFQRRFYRARELR